MTKFKKIAILFISLLVLSCSDDNDKTKIVKPDLKLLVLGNSILKHSPAPTLGWYGDWGMAATAPEKDFLYVLTKKLTDSNLYNTLTIKSQNIAYWENDFTYDLNQYPEISGQQYDIIIVRLGENVSNTENYEAALNTMINHFKTQNTKVIITGLVWDSVIKETIHQNVALNNSYKYISLINFRSNPSNYSWGLFENGAVAAHPSDFGMLTIASLLYDSTTEIQL